jgi:hypothetical protein
VSAGALWAGWFLSGIARRISNIVLIPQIGVEYGGILAYLSRRARGDSGAAV